MTTQIVNFSFGDIAVSFRADGFLNATAVAAHFGKQPRDYLKTESTQEYISVLAEHLSNKQKILIDENQLVVVKNGSAKNGGGTWLHPKLAIHFARWLNPKFAVWCDEQIENLLSGSLKTKTAKLGCLTLEQQDEIKKFHRELVQSAPKNKQAALAIGLWSAIRSKFGVTYKDVPEVHYPEVLSLMARVALEKGALSGEVLDKPKTLTCPDPALLHNTLAAAVEYFRDYGKLLQVLDKLPLTDSRMAFNTFNHVQEVCENIMKIATDWGLKNELDEPIFEPCRINFYNGNAVFW